MIRIVGFYILCKGGRTGRERVGIEADSVTYSGCHEIKLMIEQRRCFHRKLKGNKPYSYSCNFMSVGQVASDMCVWV